MLKTFDYLFIQRCYLLKCLKGQGLSAKQTT